MPKNIVQLTEVCHVRSTDWIKRVIEVTVLTIHLRASLFAVLCQGSIEVHSPLAMFQTKQTDQVEY